ncbi:MAG: DUF4340 domain-containing protein [Puniceicoccaceae bacterium]|nr:MAG: DUF4340 domain-containing protein [Puniceicoccaceae bacterium]
MSLKFTLLLALLAAGLVFSIYYFEKEWDAEARWLENRRQILGPESVDPDFLAFSHPGRGVSVELRQGPEGWEIHQPFPWRANRFAVERILNQLQFLEAETSFPVRDLPQTGQTLADYGLDPAEITLTLGRNGEIQTLRIGRTTEVGNRLYLLSTDGERVHVVNRALLDSLSLRVEELRGDEILTIPTFEVRSWSLQTRETGSLRIRLARRADRWYFETPIQARAHSTSVDTLLNSILQLRVRNFPPVPAGGGGPTGLESPLVRLAIEGNARRQTLLVGDRVPDSEQPDEHYAKLENHPAIFTLRFPQLAELRDAQVGLRERRLLTFELDRIESAVLAAAGRDPVTLQRLETGNWQVMVRGARDSLGSIPGDEAAIIRLLGDLVQLRAVPRVGFVSDAPSAADLERFGLTPPEWQVEFSIRTPATGAPDSTTNPTIRSETLLLGARHPDNPRQIYAKVRGEPFVYLVDNFILEDLSSNPLTYRNRILRALPEGARITRLSFRRLSGPETLLSTTLAGPATEEAPGLDSLDETLGHFVRRLATALRRLQAESFLADHYQSTVRLDGDSLVWHYLLDATIQLDGSPDPATERMRLYFLPVEGGARLVTGSPDHDLVFEASRDLADAITNLVFALDGAPPAERPAAVPPGSDSAGLPPS